MIGVLVVVSFGGATIVIQWIGIALTSEAFVLLTAGLLTPIPMALWATFLAVVVYLRFPDTPVNGTEPGDLIIMIGVLPAVFVVVLPTAIPTINPFLVSVGGVGVSLLAVTGGWLSVQRG